MNNNNIWKMVIQTIITILSAIGTTIGMTQTLSLGYAAFPKKEIPLFSGTLGEMQRG